MAATDRFWDQHALPALCDHIRIPAVSPAFDADWERHGHLDGAVRQAAAWINQGFGALGLRAHGLRRVGRTPLLLVEAGLDPCASSASLVFYGHLDKQPPGDGWRTGLGPWTPVVQGARLYGRGAADDGYAVFAMVGALLACRAAGGRPPPCIGVFETGEESGSADLPFWLDVLSPLTRHVSGVFCLDSGVLDHSRLWITTSLRGLASGTLSVRVLNESVHAGQGGGIVPSAFRVLRHLIARLEDSETGRLLLPHFHRDIPVARRAEAALAASLLGDALWRAFPWSRCGQGKTVLPVTGDPCEALLNRAWRPALTITGCEGIPGLALASNVLPPEVAFKLSLRLPPGVSSAESVALMKTLFESEPPYGAQVEFRPDQLSTDGWEAPALSDSWSSALRMASRSVFGESPLFFGEGGTLPMMNMLKGHFPAADIMATGVLGPGSNAHGPNEALDLPYAKRLTAVLALMLTRHGGSSPVIQTGSAALSGGVE